MKITANILFLCAVLVTALAERGRGELPPLANEIQAQWDSLALDLSNRAHFKTRNPNMDVAGETFHPQSLIQDSDRDPCDIVLRRTGALLEDLMKTEAAKTLAPRAVELKALGEKVAAVPVGDPGVRKALFAEICRVRRAIAFSNPLLDFRDMVFIKRHRSIFDHMCDQYYGITARPGGGLFVLENAFGASPSVRDVLSSAKVEQGRLKGQMLKGGNAAGARLNWDGEKRLTGDVTQGGAFLSPSLTFDGKQILFSFAECTGGREQIFHLEHPARGYWDPGRCFHIFRVNADGSGLVQLTDGSWNDLDPVGLPNGRIAFISERRGGYLRCGRACPLYTLHDMAADGSAINLLSFHDSNEWHPSVMHDGRLLWTRWDYIDRHGCVAHAPWVTRMDGTDPRALMGNYAVRSRRPDMFLHMRAVPGSSKIVATAAPHHGQAFGSLVLLDPRIPDDDAMGPVKRLTPEVAFPESQGGREVYGTPWPLSETFHLCVYNAASNGLPRRQQIAGGVRDPHVDNYGIYLVDAYGNRELIYRDPDISSSNPIPLRATPVPPTTASPFVATTGLPAKPGSVGEATMAVVNVYDTLRPWPEGMKPAAIRVFQVLPCSVPSGGLRHHETGQRVAEAGDSIVPARWVLGTAPIEADGSAHFKVPAYRQVFFQVLDEKGMAITSMRSGTAARAGEALVCMGCHEDKHQVMAPAQVTAKALKRPPSELIPDVEGSNPLSYPKLVQPVLDRHCVTCHQDPKNKAPNLAREPMSNQWYASYHSLLPFAFTAYGDHYRTVPGKFGARASKLHALLEKGHYEVRLSPEEMRRITLWLDSMSMFYGVFEREGAQAQLRGEPPRPSLE